MSWLHTNLPAPGKPSLELSHRLHTRSTKCPYIADGCDQQGRTTPTREAASACSELLADSDPARREISPVLRAAFRWTVAGLFFLGFVHLLATVSRGVPL
jgi:hypothetical protein